VAAQSRRWPDRRQHNDHGRDVGVLMIIINANNNINNNTTSIQL
jgi:hypothetical protein